MRLLRYQENELSVWDAVFASLKLIKWTFDCDDGHVPWALITSAENEQNRVKNAVKVLQFFTKFCTNFLYFLPFLDNFLASNLKTFLIDESASTRGTFSKKKSSKNINFWRNTAYFKAQKRPKNWQFLRIFGHTGRNIETGQKPGFL